MKRQPLGNIENRRLLEDRDAEDLNTLLDRLELEAKQRRSPCKPLRVTATQENEIEFNECVSREKKRVRRFIAAHTLTSTDNNLYFIVALTYESERNLNRGEILIGSPEKAKFRSKDYQLIKITPAELTKIKNENTRKALLKERRQQQQNNENQSTHEKELERYINARLEESNLAQQEKYQEQNQDLHRDLLEMKRKILQLQAEVASQKTTTDTVSCCLEEAKLRADRDSLEQIVELTDEIINGNNFIPTIETQTKTLQLLKKMGEGAIEALAPSVSGIHKVLASGCELLFGKVAGKVTDIVYQKTYAKHIPTLFKDYLNLLKDETNKHQEITEFLTTSTEYTSLNKNYSGNYQGENILLTCLKLINLKCIGKKSTIKDFRTATADVRNKIEKIQDQLNEHNQTPLVGGTIREQEPYMDKFLKCINFIAHVFEYGNDLVPMSDQGNSPTDSSEAEESNSESEVVEPRESQMVGIEAGGVAETNQNKENIVASTQTTQPAAVQSPLAKPLKPRRPRSGSKNTAPEATVGGGNQCTLFRITDIINCDGDGDALPSKRLLPR